MLRIIIGRTGCGKSLKCITEFNAYIQNNRSLENASYLFVPEQYNMITERRLLEYQINENFSVKGLLGHEVLNFKRFVHRILSIYGYSKTKELTQCGKIMLLTAAVNAKASQLIYYKALKDRQGEISRLLSLFDEFGKYGVSYEKIKSVETEDIYFGNKLHDIALLYEEYEKLKRNKYSDDNDAFSNMLELVETNNFFNNKSIWIDSFTGFTTQECMLIQLMLTQANCVTVALCTDNSGEPAFESIDNTLNNLINIAKLSGSSYEIINLSNDRKSNEIKYANKSIFQLEQNISKTKITESHKANNIFLTECEGVFDEIIYCAEKIKYLHDENNIEYKNIAVALRDTSGYDVLIKAVFKKYGIPHYIDDKKTIDNNPLIKSILALLSVIIDDWRPDDVLEFIKSDMISLSICSQDIENFIIERGLRGERSYKNSENEDCKRLYSIINIFYESLSNCIDLKSACNEVCNFFKNNGVKEKLELMIDEANRENDAEAANEYSRIWNIMLEVIQQISAFLGDCACENPIKALELLRSLLVSGFSQFKIGFLPACLDSVQIINIERSRSFDIKALFLIGANEGVIPSNFNDDGFLKDSEREQLQRFNINLAEDCENKISKESYFIYTSLSLPTEYLYVTWPLENLDGQSMTASHIIVSKIRKLFPDIKILQFKYAPVFNNVKHQTNNIVSVEKNINNELLNINGTLITSVSQIEKYYKCPYSYFMTYGLNVKPREEAALLQTDFGTVIHDIAEEISQKLFEIPDNSSYEVYDELVENAYNKIKESLRFSKYVLTEHDYNILNRVKRYAAKSFKNIKRQVEAGAFRVAGVEASFSSKDGAEFKEYTIIPKEQTDRLKTINIEGRIDRYDLMTGEDGRQFVRVVDYKTSERSASMSEYEIRSGVALQLITYLNVIVDSLTGKSVPAGALYFVFDSDIQNSKDHFTLIKANKPKSYSMKGYVLDDEEVLNGMTGGDTCVLGGTPNKNGGLTFKSKNMLKSYDELNELKQVVFDNIERAAIEISNGNYPIKPFRDEKKEKITCDYCEFRSVCAKCTTD